MNEHEANRIAAAMNQLRPDWPVRQLQTLLTSPQIADRPRRDVVVALGWVACEAGTASPYRVLESGPWWLAAGVDGQTTGRREPYDPNEFCDVCGKPHGRHPEGDHTFVSVVDQTRRLAADEDHDRRAADALAWAREAVAEAKATGPEPLAERPHKPSPNVDRLRHLAETAAGEDDPRPAPPARVHNPSEGRARVAAGNETTEAAAAAESE